MSEKVMRNHIINYLHKIHIIYPSEKYLGTRMDSGRPSFVSSDLRKVKESEYRKARDTLWKRGQKVRKSLKIE
ncbi:hypothetical protein STEG23_028904 [Scotinomys teguina]